MDFSEFSSKSYFPNKGEFNFKINQSLLKEATQITGLIPNLNRYPLKITLFENQVKLGAFNPYTFVEVLIPLEDKCLDIKGEKGQPYFMFDQETLSKISQHFNKDSGINFKYCSGNKILIIDSESTHLEFITSNYSDLDCVDFCKNLREFIYVKKIDTEFLKKAIKYNLMFCSKDDMQPNLSLLEIKDRNKLVSGNCFCMGIIESSYLDKLNLRVRFESASPLIKMLSKLDKNNTHVYDTETYHIIRDERVLFGIEKTALKFPPINKFLNGNLIQSEIKVNRFEMLSALRKLSIMDKDKDSLVGLKVVEENGNSIFRLSLANKTGKKSIVNLGIKELEVEYNFGDKEILLKLDSLIKIISYWDSEEVQIQFSLPNMVFILDHGEGYKITSICVIMSPNQDTEIEEIEE